MQPSRPLGMPQPYERSEGGYAGRHTVVTMEPPDRQEHQHGRCGHEDGEQDRRKHKLVHNYEGYAGIDPGS